MKRCLMEIELMTLYVDNAKQQEWASKEASALKFQRAHQVLESVAIYDAFRAG